jgi:hypothetical protein
MAPYLFIVSGLAFMVTLSILLTRRAYAIEKGSIKEVYGEYGGLGEVYVHFFKTYKKVGRSADNLKKLAFQYIFHILVRVLYYIKALTNGAYSFARNQFMKNAVKNKASVSFFWSHLKEYKKQIETEERKAKK